MFFMDSTQELIKFVLQNILTICDSLIKISLMIFNSCEIRRNFHAAMMMMMTIREEGSKKKYFQWALKKEIEAWRMAEKRETRERDQQHVKLKLNKNNSSVCSRAQFSLNLTLDRVGFAAALFLFIVHIKLFAPMILGYFIWWSASNKKIIIKWQRNFYLKKKLNKKSAFK